MELVEYDIIKWTIVVVAYDYSSQILTNFKKPLFPLTKKKVKDILADE